MMSETASLRNMENIQPHHLMNLSLDARHALRSHLELEACLQERILALPEDDYCSRDIESLQLGAGYAYLRLTGGLAAPDDDSIERTAEILEGFFRMRPRNRYLDEHAVYETRKLIHEAAISHHTEVPASIDPYEVSAAARFLEGYTLVETFVGPD